MNIDPSALAAAHDELTAATRELAPHAVRRNAVVPSDHLIYRIHQTTRPSPQAREVLGRMAGAVAHLIEAEGYRVIVAVPDGDPWGNTPLGVTDHRGKTVTIDPNLQERMAVGTMIHELAHIRLRHLQRRMTGNMERESAEVEAESVSYVVARALGLNLITFAAPYVANYAHGNMRYLANTRRMVLRTAAEILADL